MNHRVELIDMPTFQVGGFVAYNKAEDFYTIFINAKLTYEQRLEKYKHELEHIENGDCETLDLSADEIEKIAHKR